MPRDGTETYILPFPDVAEDTTIESAVYNGFTNDVAQDLNTPRPIKFGGTGATTGPDALENLGGELAEQLVDNYDSFPFQSGSFYSAAGATSPPVTGHAFAGICYTAVVASDATTDMFLEATDRDDTVQPGAKYIRQKKAGVWSLWQKFAGVSTGTVPPAGAGDNALWWDPTLGRLFVYYNDGNSKQWVETNAVPDVDPNTYVEISGDTMSGFLTLNANPTAALHASPKQYVDAQDAATLAAAATAGNTNFVNVSGDAMTGALALSGNAVNPLEAVPKQQLDASVASAGTKKNYIVNGGMQVSQEWPLFSLTVSSYYPVDQFLGQYVHGGAVAYAQVAVAAPSGSKFRLRATVTTPDAAVAAGDYFNIVQKIEGYRVADLLFGTASAKSVTLRFGVKAPAGTYSVALMNSAGNRTYIATYVIAAGEANTDVVKSVTIPGDQSGTWLADNGTGIQVIWGLMGGTTYQGATNTWTATALFVAAAQFNFMGTNGNTFELFDVGMYDGATVPPYVLTDYISELQVCQRYWETSFATGVRAGSPPATAVGPETMHVGAVASANVQGHGVRFTVRKRTTPTVIAYSWLTGAANMMHDALLGSDRTATTDLPGETGFRCYCAQGATATNILWHWSANARM